MRIEDYDRCISLTVAEQRTLARELSETMGTTRKAMAPLGHLAGLQRLVTPINDALAMVDGKCGCSDRVRLILLNHCARQNRTFWGWDSTAWREVIGTSQRSLVSTNCVASGGEREALIAVAYLLQCINDTSCFKGLERLALAELVFGKEQVAATLKRVTDTAETWGYRGHNQQLMSMVAELLLMNGRPDLESLTAGLVKEARNRWCDSVARSALYFQLTRVLRASGLVVDEPKVRDTVDREFTHAAGIANIASEWVAMAEGVVTLTGVRRTNG